MELLRKWRRKLSKPLLFGLYGMIGCLIASLLLGELWLLMTKLPPSTGRQPQAVVMVIDTSGSMYEIVSGDSQPTGKIINIDGNQYTEVIGGTTKLDEVKTAATNFVNRQNLNLARNSKNQDQIAVIGFGTNVNVATPLTSDLKTIERAIASLDDRGGTNMDLALKRAKKELNQTQLSQNILLFTDGIPHSSEDTLKEAQSIVGEQINLVAIATGDADTEFLTNLTGDENKVVFANTGNFEQAFAEAEKAIYGNQLVESGETGDYSLLYGSLRMGVWSSLLALGVSLALIIGQNHYLHRRLFSPSEATLGIISSLLAGFIAGSIGQLVFDISLNIPYLTLISRLMGWSLLGSLVGGGMSLFVPNLPFKRGLLGGLIGGLLGAIAFLVITNYSSVIIGRLIGAGILGFCIGLMVALIEQLNRQFSVTIHWRENEQTTISLGENPILLGSSKNAHIYLPQSQGYYPITAKIYTENNQIIMEYDTEYAQAKGMKKLKHQLEDKTRRKLGLITLEFNQNKMLKDNS